MHEPSLFRARAHNCYYDEGRACEVCIQITPYVNRDKKKEGKSCMKKMSCCSTDIAEDKLEPYQLRALYIRQISRFAQKGTFGQALNVFKEVSLCLSRYSY